MQPTYITLSSVGSSPWKVVNWQIAPQEISFEVIANSSSVYSIAATSPNSSAPTAFTIFSGSSNALFSIGSSVTAPLVGPIAAYQFSITTLSSAGAKATLIALQDGVG
jgi:hypothetical protein